MHVDVQLSDMKRGATDNDTAAGLEKLLATTYRIHWECGIQMNETIADSAFVLTIGGFTAWMMLPTFCNFEFYI